MMFQACNIVKGKQQSCYMCLETLQYPALCILHSLQRSTYSAIDHIHINVCLFGPLVPEIRVIQRDVCAVSGCDKTGLKADIRITSNHNQICHFGSCLVVNQRQPVSYQMEELRINTTNKLFIYHLFFFFFFPYSIHLSKGGSSSLRLNCDGLCPTLEDLVNVLLTELGPFILFIHDGPIGATSQQILNLLLR